MKVTIVTERTEIVKYTYELDLTITRASDAQNYIDNHYTNYGMVIHKEGIEHGIDYTDECLVSASVTDLTVINIKES